MSSLFIFFLFVGKQLKVTENEGDKDLHWVSWWPWVSAHRGRGGAVSICHCILARWVVLSVMVKPLRLLVIESSSEAEMFKKICTWAKSILLVYIMCLEREEEKIKTKNLEWTLWGLDGPKAKELDQLVLFLVVSYTKCVGEKGQTEKESESAYGRVCAWAATGTPTVYLSSWVYLGGENR